MIDKVSSYHACLPLTRSLRELCFGRAEIASLRLAPPRLVSGTIVVLLVVRR